MPTREDEAVAYADLANSLKSRPGAWTLMLSRSTGEALLRMIRRLAKERDDSKDTSARLYVELLVERSRGRCG